MWTELIAKLHFHSSDILTLGVENLAAVLTCMFCWMRGAMQDRIAAVMFIVCWMGFEVTLAMTQLTTGDWRQQLILTVIFDVGPALGFLYLSIRHNNLWFGAAAITQGVQFALDALDHATAEPLGTPMPVLLISGINVLNLVMMGAMIGSTCSAIARRRGLAGHPRMSPLGHTVA